MYLEDLSKLAVPMNEIDSYLTKKLPLLKCHLDDAYIYPQATFSQFFLTLGLYNFSIEVALQIIDIFLVEG